MTTQPAPSELEKKLQSRLEQALDNRDKQQAKFKQLQAHLQKLFNKFPNRPRESVAELDEKIAKLERERTITSISLAQERQILRQINGIKKSKNQVVEYLSHDKEIQETKKTLDELRSGLTVIHAGIDELEAGLAKVRLASKLGCKTQDLKSIKVDCPQDKIGMVIGKNGAMIKQIMETAKVTMDVQKDDHTIEITGSDAAIATAVAEIDKITLAVEEAFEAPTSLVEYLTSRHISVIANLREEYNDLYLDVSRNKNVTIRGMPDRVASLKKYLLEMDIVSEDRELHGRQSQILVGRKGVTIDKMVTDHKVAINVEKTGDDTAVATVVGPSDCVRAAMEEIEELMDQNKEVVEKIPVHSLFKRIALADSGKIIKELQAKVNETLKESEGNAYLTFEKDQNDKENPELLVKAKQAFITSAMELVEAGLKELDSLIIHVQVDPYIIPRMIGKGGETIKKLTQEIPGFVEVERGSGKVSVAATTPETRDSLLEEINKLIASNQILRVDGDPAIMKAQYRELLRSKTKAEISELSWLVSDDEKDQFILRGTQEGNEKAKQILLDFLAENHIEEVAVTEEDLDALLSGGKDSSISKFANDLGVNMYVDKARFMVIVRASKEKVKSAVEKLNQFLNGGDGFSVARLTVTEQVVGVIIGKGGKTRIGLQNKYEGVSINISKSQCVSIRGPEEKVAECRVEMLKMISSARVTQTMDVTEDQVKKLEQNDTIKRTSQGMAVQINIEDGKASIRGFFYDVLDAVSLLKEQLTGVYHSAIELDVSQFAKVRATCRDPSHFQRMEEATGATVKLDLTTGSISISGKRSNVKKAKEQMIGFLKFLFPDEFATFKISKPLHLSVGQATALADVSANAGGATVYLDRDLSSVIVRATDPEKVKLASELVLKKIKEGEKLVYVLELDTSEAWLLPMIIGKNGVQVSALQKDSGCRIDVSKESRTVTVTGQTEHEVAKVNSALNELLDKARRECVFVSIPDAAMPAFVGKGGLHIKEFASKHGVDVQRMRKGVHQFKLAGPEDAVENSKKALADWVAKWEESSGSITIPLEKQQVPMIIGNKGETARALQEEFGCYIDVDRNALTATVRGGTLEARQNTVDKLKTVIVRVKEEEAAKPVMEPTTEDLPGPLADKTEDGQERASSNDAVVAKNASDRVDRSAEFPTKPVGLTIAPKRNRKKSQKNATMDAKVQTGTAAGRNLFQLLISEPTPETDKVPSGGGNKSFDEAWDSSTVSSGAGSPAATDDESGGPVTSSR